MLSSPPNIPPSLFQIQRSGLLNSIGDLVDLFFVDAPNLASGPIPDDVAPFFKGPYYEWWNAEKDEETGRWNYNNWLTSLAHIEDICRLHGPFDGVMGFSQGGAAVALLVGLQRTGRALKTQPMLGFCICFAGIRVRDPHLDGCFNALQNVPSVHVIGDKDPVKRMTNMLIESFDNPIVINHPKGHVVPQLADGDVERMRAFLIARQKTSSM
jgi:hypothetical protein